MDKNFLKPKLPTVGKSSRICHLICVHLHDHDEIMCAVIDILKKIVCVYTCTWVHMCICSFRGYLESVLSFYLIGLKD